MICLVSKNRLKDFKVKNISLKNEINLVYYNPDTFEPMTSQEYNDYIRKKANKIHNRIHNNGKIQKTDIDFLIKELTRLSKRLENDLSSKSK